MTTDDPASRGFSLKRWSQRKLAAARAASSPPTPDVAAPAPGGSVASVAPHPASPRQTSDAAGDGAAAEAALPPIESLTIDSDFSAFLGPKVDPAVKLQALKKLFRDPRFNVMDGLDVYIDDYSIADPLPPELARTLAHARYVFDPPRTRVNEAGVVEDIPADEAREGAEAAQAEATTQPQVTIATDASIADVRSPPPSVAPNPQPESAPDEAKPREGSDPARR